MESPIGLLNKAVVSSCGIEYEHTFAVADFGHKPNYDIILGRPFMRQLKMIQDWGYNYIYLRQPNTITRIDLRDHSYKDVIHTPVRDMVSTIATDSSPAWLNTEKPVWMYGLKENEDERSSSSSDYIPEPFPEHELEPLGWHDILATLDVCANVHAQTHCDENGYDIVSVNMVHIVMKGDPILEERDQASIDNDPDTEVTNSSCYEEDDSRRTGC